jgi:hypothetical protein
MASRESESDRVAKFFHLSFVHLLFIFIFMPDDIAPTQLMPGQLLARGVSRAMRSHDFVAVEELVPTSGLRVDVMALGPKGEIWIVECKSSRADFQSDHKWHGYLEWCDRFFWAVDSDFPTELLPDETGLILADAYDAEIIRMGPEAKLATARRKVMVQKFARHAAMRAQAARDPGFVNVF